MLHLPKVGFSVYFSVSHKINFAASLGCEERRGRMHSPAIKGLIAVWNVDLSHTRKKAFLFETLILVISRVGALRGCSEGASLPIYVSTLYIETTPIHSLLGSAPLSHIHEDLRTLSHIQQKTLSAILSMSTKK